MNIEERKDLLVRLGIYFKSNDSEWLDIKNIAYEANKWFTPQFIELAVTNIEKNFLQYNELQKLIKTYAIPEVNNSPKKIGVVMAGNIPLVGFHDLLCVFISGHYCIIKLSSKDNVLLPHLIKKMTQWNSNVENYFTISEMLKGCDAYIATGSNNSSRYFEYYFRNYPHIIRKNRTSVAVLKGDETAEQLSRLADDVYQYFGLGCRNVTKVFVPNNYDFVPLLDAFKKYNYLADHHKYKNNYDYNLALLLLNQRKYMTNESILLVEDNSHFSPISQLHYQFYSDKNEIDNLLGKDESIQCIVGNDHINFGCAQTPDVCTYADGIDTMEFLMRLNQVNENAELRSS